jgi:hypothetical protein
LRYREFPFKLALVAKLPEQNIIFSVNEDVILAIDTDGLSDSHTGILRLDHFEREKTSNAGLEYILPNI